MKHLLMLLLITSLFLFVSCQNKVPEVGDVIEVNEAEWELIWSDEFDQETINTDNWNIADGPDGLNNDINYNRPENVYLEDSMLVLRQMRESYGGLDYTTGKVNSQNKIAFLYGRIEVRGKIPEGKGLHTAYWLLHEGCSGWAGGDNSQCVWPPEIDIVEVLGQDPYVFHTTYHAGTPLVKRGKGELHYRPEKVTDDFHIYAVEWEPEEIRWYFDGELIFTANDVFVKDVHLPFGITLDTVVGGNWPQPPNEYTVFPSYNYIDYVRVYKNVENPNPSVPESTATPESETETNLSSIISFADRENWPVKNMVDMDPNTFWSSGVMQEPGQWIILDFGKELTFDELIISAQKPEDSTVEGWVDDYMRGYRIQVSEDGKNFDTVIVEGENNESVLLLTFAEVMQTHYLRIEQTGSSDEYWWTIFEIDLLLNGKSTLYEE